MTKRNKLLLTILPLCACLCVTGSGCKDGAIGGGAKAEVKVKYKSAELEEKEADETTGRGTGPGPGTGGGTGPGTLTGRITFKGTPPTLAPLVAMGANVRDAQVCSAMNVPDDKFHVGPNGGLANVFIYLQSAPKKAPAEENEPAAPVLDQRYCRFKPHALIVRTGRPLKILNSDPIAHNTNIKTLRQSGFNQVVNKDGSEHTFKRAEKVPASTSCEFHSWMQAYVLVIDHPYAAVTGPDGSFTIENLPPGKHNFLVWHEAGDLINPRWSVTINSGDNAAELSFEASDFKKL